MDCNKDMLSAEENKRYWAEVYPTSTTKIPMRSFYTFLSDEELATLISDGIHEQMKRERGARDDRDDQVPARACAKFVALGY